MSRGPRTVALLLAGGSGRRAGGPKQWRRAGGRSLLAHAAAGLWAAREVAGIVAVVPAADVGRARAELAGLDGGRWLEVVAGGSTRHRSSAAGLAALPDPCELVLVHDAARPFASPALLRRVLRAARAHGAAVPALPVADSTIELDAGGRLERYLPRPRLRAVQTPQGFARTVLEEAFARTRRDDWGDDASCARAAGHPVAVVEGEEANRKITTAAELAAALRALRRREG